MVRSLWICVLVLLRVGLAQALAGPIYVIYTVDVESRGKNIDQNIYGILPGQRERYGIEKMMDILDKHGVQGTFLVNVYEAPVVGQEAMEKVCRTIRDRGHDLQLHTHPGPVFGVSTMQAADLAKQVEILQHGVDFIDRCAGERVLAHRAGGYWADLDTIKACQQTGIGVELSYNAYWPNEMSQSNLTVNASFVRDDVLCVPLSSYIQVSVPGYKSMRFIDIESSSPQEILKVVYDLHAHGVKTATLMAHSFSLNRNGKPGDRVALVLDQIIGEFVVDPRVEVVSASQLYEIWKENPDAVIGADYLPTTGLWMTYTRAWQRLDEGWKNRVVAIAPVGLAAGFVLVVAVRRGRRKRKAAQAGSPA